jgi:hypothetical protein
MEHVRVDCEAIMTKGVQILITLCISKVDSRVKLGLDTHKCRVSLKYLMESIPKFIVRLKGSNKNTSKT